MNYIEVLDDLIPFSSKLAEKVKSTRIRIARNLEGYPLQPGLTREQRLEIEQKII